MERLINSKLFEKMYTAADAKEKEAITKDAVALDTKSIESKMRSSSTRDLEECSFGTVRSIAKKLYIKNYCRKAKWELIREITEIQKDVSAMVQGASTISDLIGEQ